MHLIGICEKESTFHPKEAMLISHELSYPDKCSLFEILSNRTEEVVLYSN